MWSGLSNLFQSIDRTADLCGIFGTQVLPPGDLAVEGLIVRFSRKCTCVELPLLRTPARPRDCSNG